ncbi:MAG: hypothetical protein Q7J35_04870 [Candidatus Methanoperedens sp.]|nr:hypothetical protein [Candidatus Methanoperedens sp.]
MFSFSTMYAIFAVMVVFLPVPAPARIRWGVGCGFRIGAGGGFSKVGESEKVFFLDQKYFFSFPSITICRTADERTINTFGNYYLNGAGV